jgi:signal transduction histidine kinase
MALFATRDHDTGPAQRLHRAFSMLARVLRWPGLAAWAFAGWLTRVSAKGIGLLWALVRRAAPIADGPLAVALFAFVVLGPPGSLYTQPSLPSITLQGAQLLPLAVLRHRPVHAWATMAIGNALGFLVVDYYPGISILVLVGAVAVVCSRVDRAAAARTGMLTSFALLPTLWHPSFSLEALTFWLIPIVIAMVFGQNLRSRHQAEAELAVAQARSTEERQHRAVLEERSRIARELHDVVAHHVSLIAVQSQSAPRRIAGLPDEGIADFEEINATARDAMAEMRRVLAVLRDEASHADRAPQPGAHALADLVASVEQSGQPVTLQITGQPRALRTAVDVSVYRLVQEALTNVRRHAGPTTATVTVDYQPARVRVRVCDEGVGDRGRRDGLGLTGMHERVAMLGGELYAGDHQGGGFVVDASLPYDRGSGE